MKRRALLHLALLVTGCSGCDGEEEKPPALPQPDPIHWVRTPLWGFDLQLPEPWSKSYKLRDKGYLHFSGPKDDGFHPQLQLLWRPTEMKFRHWAERQEDKFRHAPGVEVYSDGDTSLAGMPARYLMYGQKAKHPETGVEGDYRTIDFYFAGHGHVGMLRGVCTARTFPEYRVLFEEIARRLSYRG